MRYIPGRGLLLIAYRQGIEMAKIPDGYVEGVEKRNEAFLQALNGEDDLGMVIRHIECSGATRLDFPFREDPRPFNFTG